MHFAFFAVTAIVPLVLAAPTSQANATSACSLSTVVQPGGPNTLAPPPSGQNLALIALAMGTQNYTCTANLTAAPTAVGAKANLYDATCAVASNPNANPSSITPDGKPSIGKHFFVDATTPEFDVNTLGNTQLKKAEAVNSICPSENVSLLRLVAQTGVSTSRVKQIYRLNTVGGVAPSTCSGRAVGDTITVEYSAQYWFYT